MASDRRIVFIGDCQAGVLAHIYEDFVAPFSKETIRCIVAGSKASDADLRGIEEADVVVSQVFNLEQQTTRAGMRSDAVCIEFPALFVGSLWPFSAQVAHIKNRPTVGHRDGPYPAQLGDTFLNRLIIEGVEAEEALRRYLELDIARVAHIDRLFELHLGAQELRDERTDFAFSRTIEAQFRSTQLFLTAHHPTLALMIPLIRGVFERLGVPSSIIESAVQAQLVPPFPNHALPIHPGVIRHFELRFVDEWSRYLYNDEGSFTFSEYVIRYMNFTWNNDLHEGLALAHGSEIARAHATLERALQLSPESVAGWRTLSGLLRRMRRCAEARAAAARAVALNPKEPASRVELARVMLEEGDQISAEAEARRAIAAFPSDSQAHYVLAEVLLSAARSDEAAEVLNSVIVSKPHDANARALLDRILLPPQASRKIGAMKDILPQREQIDAQAISRRAKIEVLFLQTADATYWPLLELTSSTVREYCLRHKWNYESFFGVVRGFHPWHATYNRIPLLRRLVEGGYRGWVCYLDADAYVADLEFDLGKYLDDKEELALIIAAGGSSPWWNINAGVFLINLGHAVGQAIVHTWSLGFDKITDDQLRTAVTPWSLIEEDQYLLGQALQNIPDARQNIVIEREQPRLLNYVDGRFIRQVLRAEGSFASRVAYLRSEVEKLVRSELHISEEVLNESKGQTHDAFVRALYRVLLLREPDPIGLAHSVARMGAGVSFEEEMRVILKSQEFASNCREFLGTFVRGKMPRTNLTNLANKYGSDKGTRSGSSPHKYTYLYDLILDSYRDWEVNFLELGLAVGGPEVGGAVDRQVDSPSVQMWLEYFPRSHVYGFDISDFSHMKHPRFTFVRGDGGSTDDLQRLANSARGFDIIIDDGSHASYHQQLAFKHLFPKLRSGGTYIIEDLQWQSPAYEGKPILLPKTREFMVKYFEGDEYMQNDLLSEDFMREVKSSVASYAWFPAFSGEASPAKIFVLRKFGKVSA